jgi:hypothetical protein
MSICDVQKKRHPLFFVAHKPALTRPSSTSQLLCRPLMLCAHSYHVATPTFHQWRDPRHVYGLNFSKQEDAEVFATAAAAAIEELKALAADPVAAKIATSAQNTSLPRVCKTHELTFTHASTAAPTLAHARAHAPIDPSTHAHAQHCASCEVHLFPRSCTHYHLHAPRTSTRSHLHVHFPRAVAQVPHPL